MSVIYMVYTWSIPVICSPYQYVRYIPSKNLVSLFSTFFYNDIHLIYYVYHFDIHSISNVYHYKKGAEQNHEVFTRYIPDILVRITGLYHLYTLYIPFTNRSGSDIPVIYQEYSLYILHGLSLVYTLYIPSIYIVYL